MCNNNFLLIFGVAIGIQLFGVSETRVARIFNQNYDTEHDVRYYVSVMNSYTNDTPQHLCGGAIIDNRHILTAAHCVFGHTKDELLVRSGWITNNTSTGDQSILHKVLKVMYPKDYHNSTCRSHQHDVAVIKVQKKFDLTNDKLYKKLYLPEYDADYEDFDVKFTGFGAEKIGLVASKSPDSSVQTVFKYPKELKFFKTKIVPLEECINEISVILTDENICTQAKNEDGFSCIGDSGGPLVYEDVIVGIRNHHKDCVQSQPEIFTKVSSYLRFIKKCLNHQFSHEIVYA